jgi:two-component system response regulator FimZ (fimbrial Z protein)
MQAPETLNIINKLSPREKEVAICIMEGMSTSLIAEKLGLKSNTISTTKNRIFIKLQVDSLVGLYKVLMG